MPYLEVFAFLQLLDLMTTMAAFRLGGQEAGPVVRMLMQFGPVAGVVLAKAAAFLAAGACLWLRRERVIIKVNYFFGAVVLWNMFGILRALALRG